MKKIFFILFALFSGILSKAQCHASFTSGIYVQYVNNLVLFYNNSTYGSLSSGSYYFITVRYGDGNSIYVTHTTNIPSHNYNIAGTYAATLTTGIKDALGNITCQDSIVQSVLAYYTPCKAAIAGLTGSSSVNTLTFNVYNPSATPGVIYHWDFGDGTKDTGLSVYHPFIGPLGSDTFTVKLTDTVGSCTNIDSTVVVVFVQSPCYSYIINSIYPNDSLLFGAYQINHFSGMIYNWDFGDATTDTGKFVYHVYTPPTTPGTYPYKVKLYASQGTPASCTSVDSMMVYVKVDTPLNCATVYSNLYPYAHGMAGYGNLSATSHHLSTITPSYDYGDGSAITDSANHTYTTPGTYTIKCNVDWKNSNTNAHECSDSTSATVTVPNWDGVIYGDISYDSLTYTGTQSNIKVYLIQFNPTTNILSAIDSVITGGTGLLPYQFNKVHAGNYLVKAAKSYTSSGTGLLPTYHDSSLYWSAAQSIYNSGGTWTGANIWLKSGSVTTGPGFIGGNVSLGANKSASGGVSGMDILLMDQNNQAITSTQTDGNGNYSFTNIPIGNYKVYPEAMNYTTVPASNIQVTTTNTSVSGVLFHQDDAKMSIEPHFLGVNDPLANAGSIYVAPMPATNSITFSWFNCNLNNAIVQISNSLGQRLFESSLDQGSTKSGKKELNISSLPAGVYYLNIKDRADLSTLKVIKR